MIVSKKGNFRINLKAYAEIGTQKRRSCRQSAPLRQINDSYHTLDQNSQSNNDSSSIIDQQKLARIRKLSKKTLLSYHRNLQFYHSNQQKLLRTIQTQLKQRNYLHQQSIVCMLTTGTQIPIKPSTNIEKVQKQLQQLNKFLEDLYQKKRIKQILITCQNIKQEDNAIADKVNFDQFCHIHQDIDIIQSFFVNDYISEYQNICMKFGTVQPYLQSHLRIRNQIQCSRRDFKKFYQIKRGTIPKYSHLNKR